ncbi:MAG: YqzL family protein [Epulopiscium sp.]|mgnify:CR=1 FL=1|nr:YqzL family protein [Candidatus Epulonipiscium sp.]
MLEKVFWDVFKKTGNIEAYLASKECTHCKFNEEVSEELFPHIKHSKEEKAKER